MKKEFNHSDVFLIPIVEPYDLIYAPLQGVRAVVNRAESRRIAEFLSGEARDGKTDTLCEYLSEPPHILHVVSEGPITRPLFLGLIPTRDCNLSCRYCNFTTSEKHKVIMSLDLVMRSIDAYLGLLSQNGNSRADLHFFGGEPFYAKTVVVSAVEYALFKALKMGIDVYLEATTNGVYDSELCHWIADSFDTIILSLDGPKEIQDKQRPSLSGASTFETVHRNAKIFSEGSAELVLRSCVTGQTTAQMKEIARWMTQEYLPAAICFEPLTSTSRAQMAGLFPPEPWDFAREFCKILEMLAPTGIDVICSTVDIYKVQNTPCALGKDALIVAADGSVYACYLLPDEWKQRGLNLKIGSVREDGFEFDMGAVEGVRKLANQKRTICTGCLCLYHCAGGCRVHHEINHRFYDDLCIYTRIITIYKLLMDLGQNDLANFWLSNHDLVKKTTLQPTDRLEEQEL